MSPTPSAPPRATDNAPAPAAPHGAAMSAFEWTLLLALSSRFALRAPVLRDLAAFVRRLAPRSRYEKVPGVGHFLMMERPEAVNPLLTTFLSRQGVLR